MIYLTESPNDRELLPHFGGLAVLAPIPHGDFCFFGFWENSEPIRISGERKKIGDIVSCLSDTGRYLAQWQAAREAGFDRLFLIVEGLVRPGQGGLLETRKGKEWAPLFPYIEHRRFYSYLDEVANYLGVQVKTTSSPRETAMAVINLYLLYQEPPEKHISLKQFYVPSTAAHLFGKPSIVRRMAKELEGIGWDRSKAVEAAFGSVYEMVTASEEEWRKIEGIGKKTAKSAVEEIRRVT